MNFVCCLHFPKKEISALEKSGTMILEQVIEKKTTLNIYPELFFLSVLLKTT